MDDYNNQNQYPDKQNDGGSNGWQNGSGSQPQGDPWQTDNSGWQQNQPRGQWQNNQPGGQWQNNQPGGQWQNNQSGGQWQNNQFGGQQPPQRNGQALASMIFGILALVSCCIPFVQFPLAVIAIVLVILSKKKRPLTGFAIAGLVLGIISVLISIAMTIYLGYAFTLMNDPEFWQLYQEMMGRYQ